MYAEDIKEFMEMYKNLLIEEGYDLELIHNADETFLFPGEERVKVFCRATDGTPTNGTGKADEHITLLLCTSAAGKAMRPLVIFPLKTLPPLTQATREYFAVAGSESGWINDDTFCRWARDEYIPEINNIRARIGKPNARALFILDGHGSRADAEFRRLMSENNVDILIIPAHSSTILQPLDLCVNGMLKRLLSMYYSPPAGADLPTRRSYLMERTRLVLGTVMTELYITSGFEQAGFWPLDVERPLKSPLLLTIPRPTPEVTTGKRKRGPDISAQILQPIIGPVFPRAEQPKPAPKPRKKRAPKKAASTTSTM